MGKIKARDIVPWWPRPRRTTGKMWDEPAFLPYVWRLLPEELDKSESSMRLAKMAIENGLTLEGYRDPDFVLAVQTEIELERLARMRAIRYLEGTWD